MFGSKTRDNLPKVRGIILHIGYEKCGSKSIQHFIDVNQASLREKGFRTSETMRVIRRDLGLEAYAKGGEDCSDYIKRKGINFVSEDAFREELREKLYEEFAAHPDDQWMFSYEGYLNLNTRQVRVLADLLKPLSDNIQIICFVRRQDRYSISGYTTRLRNQGMTERAPLRNEAGEYSGVYYYTLLERWRKAFSGAKMSVNAYEDFPDVVPVFMNEIGLTDGDFEMPERQNTSLSAFSQEVLRRFNADYAKSAPWKAHARELRIRLRNRLPTGKSQLPSKAEVDEYLEYFAADNQRLMAKYLPKTTAFDDELIDYPDQPEIPEVSKEDIETWLEEAAMVAGIQT